MTNNKTKQSHQPPPLHLDSDSLSLRILRFQWILPGDSPPLLHQVHHTPISHHRILTRGRTRSEKFTVERPRTFHSGWESDSGDLRWASRARQPSRGMYCKQPVTHSAIAVLSPDTATILLPHYKYVRPAPGLHIKLDA